MDKFGRWPQKIVLDLELLQLGRRERHRGISMNIKDAATASGLSIDTIRFYEKTGMLPKVPRDARGWRRFDAGAIEWLRNLERLRATGMPMSDMRRFAVLVHASEAAMAGAEAERLAILQTHAERLAARRQEVEACQAFLDHKISVYSTMKGDRA
jgi:MerR family transcriptional regulator, aldehyde-responsive regulator